MTAKILIPLKLFSISSLVTLTMLFIACYVWTNFQPIEVANLMFWVGAIPIIAGGSFFYPHNKYQGQSVAMMTTLKDKVPDTAESFRHNEHKKTQRMVQGIAIATPGIILMILSWLVISNN